MRPFSRFVAVFALAGYVVTSQSTALGDKKNESEEYEGTRRTSKIEVILLPEPSSPTASSIEHPRETASNWVVTPPDSTAANSGNVAELSDQSAAEDSNWPFTIFLLAFTGIGSAIAFLVQMYKGASFAYVLVSVPIGGVCGFAVGVIIIVLLAILTVGLVVWGAFAVLAGAGGCCCYCACACR